MNMKIEHTHTTMPITGLGDGAYSFTNFLSKCSVSQLTSAKYMPGASELIV